MEAEGDSTSNFGQGGQGPVKWGPSNFERWVGPRQILSRRWAPWAGRLSLCESVKFRAVGGPHGGHDGGGASLCVSAESCAKCVDTKYSTSLDRVSTV